MSRDPAYLKDILACAKRVQSAIEGYTKNTLAADWIRLAAIVRQIEII